MTHLPLNNPQVPTPLDQAVFAHRQRMGMGHPRCPVPASTKRKTPTFAEVLEGHRARWALSNPVELTKELELLDRQNANPKIICELQRTLNDMMAARAGTYKPTTPAV